MPEAKIFIKIKWSSGFPDNIGTQPAGELFI